MNEFQYLGSQIESSGRVMLDVERRIAQASKAFGALRKWVLFNRDLKVITKHKVYQACVLSVLLITNKQQWSQQITSLEIKQR